MKDEAETQTTELLLSTLDEFWLTVPEAMRYLKVSQRTLYRLMQDGTLPYYLITGTRQRRFKRDELDQLLVKQEPGSVAQDEDDSDDSES
ncbi:MAG: helix-turn-helix domain-containing protein [Chloroflexota bacterium]